MAGVGAVVGATAALGRLYSNSGDDVGRAGAVVDAACETWLTTLLVTFSAVPAVAPVDATTLTTAAVAAPELTSTGVTSWLVARLVTVLLMLLDVAVVGGVLLALAPVFAIAALVAPVELVAAVPLGFSVTIDPAGCVAPVPLATTCTVP